MLKAVFSLALLILVAPGLASANSRFTVKNDSRDNVQVFIYNGGDTVCAVAAKDPYVSPGESESYGCEGNGKHRCKVTVIMPGNGDTACTDSDDLWSKCDAVSVIHVGDDETLVISSNYKTCSIE